MKQGAMVGWAGLKRRSKQAALKAQTEKLRNIDLRKALHTLGKKAFEQGVLETELAEHFHAIRDLDSRISEMREKAVADSEETKMETLKRVSKDTAKASQAQALTLKREHLITELGREVNAQKDLILTQELNDESSVIGDIENRIWEKEEEIRGLGDGGKSGMQTLAVAAAIVILAVIGFGLFRMIGNKKELAFDPTDAQAVAAIYDAAISDKKVQKRSVGGVDLYFLPNSDEPLTGWIRKENEKCILQVSKGVLHGIWLEYYPNEQIKNKGIYKNGIKEGIQEGWYENGQKEDEIEFGERGVVTVKKWKPNGEPCTETNVINGNGKAVSYNDDGSPSSIITYKNGEGSLRILTDAETSKLLDQALNILENKNQPKTDSSLDKSHSPAEQSNGNGSHGAQGSLLAEVRDILSQRYRGQPELQQEIERGVMSLSKIYPELPAAALVRKFEQIATGK